MRTTIRGGCLAALLALLVQAPALGQATIFSNFCQTQFGICPTGPAPIGAPCTCSAPGRIDPGRIVFPPPNWSNACGTMYGVCYGAPSPIGAPCSCGNVPGQVIPIR